MADENPFSDPSVAATAVPSQEPSWMNPSTYEPPDEGAAPVDTQPKNSSWMDAGSSTSAPSPVPRPTEPLMELSCFKLPPAIQLMRTGNIISAVLLAMIAAFKIESGRADVTTGIVALYLFAFAFLIFLFETHCGITAKMIAGNLGFMVAMLTFNGYHALGIFTGIFIVLTALLNGFVIFKYPNYERSVRISDLGDA